MFAATRRRYIGALVLILLSRGYAGTAGYGGIDVHDGFGPLWQERALLTLTNACRIDPRGYRDRFLGVSGILTAEAYPAVDPLFYNSQLNRCARSHAADMASRCGLSHNSCDGEQWVNRVRSCYDNGNGIAENIAYSRHWPQSTLSQWLLDGPVEAPAPDRSSTDGHRRNIMHDDYREIGCGYAVGPVGYRDSGNPYWVQDFGDGTSAYSHLALSAGAHLFLEDGQITFMAIYHSSDGKSALQAHCIVDNRAYDMQRTLGVDARGVYERSLAMRSDCRSYYFEFVDEMGDTARYPTEGLLYTYGEGECQRIFSFTEAAALTNPRLRMLDDVIRPRAVMSIGRVPNSVLYDCRGRLITRRGRPDAGNSARIKDPAACIYLYMPAAGVKHPFE
jgi:hypothetical protein